MFGEMVVDLHTVAGEEDGKVAATPLALPSVLTKWYKIHRPPADGAISPPPTIPLSMVSIANINEDNSDKSAPIIFPPINHENLQISQNPPHIHKNITSITSPRYNSDSDSDTNSVANSNSSSSFSPSESSLVSHSPRSSSPKTWPAAEKARLSDSWTEMFYFKVNGIIRFLWASFASSRRLLLSSRSAGLTAALILFLYFRKARRLRVGKQCRTGLINFNIIKERDEKIKQLLDQISRMNQVLLKLHRVPTIPSS